MSFIDTFGKYGVHINVFYFVLIVRITGKCKCRKPESGMIEQDIKDFDIDRT
jgi:histidinol phosphatase-like enzyme